jgi:hypothetical protein
LETAKEPWSRFPLTKTAPRTMRRVRFAALHSRHRPTAARAASLRTCMQAPPPNAVIVAESRTGTAATEARVRAATHAHARECRRLHRRVVQHLRWAFASDRRRVPPRGRQGPTARTSMRTGGVWSGSASVQHGARACVRASRARACLPHTC